MAYSYTYNLFVALKPDSIYNLLLLYDLDKHLNLPVQTVMQDSSAKKREKYEND